MQRNRKWIAGVMYHRTLKGELDVDADARDAATLLDDPASGPAAASRLAGAADAASDDEGKQLKQKSVAGKKAEKAAVARSKKRWRSIKAASVREVSLQRSAPRATRAPAACSWRSIWRCRSRAFACRVGRSAL